MRISFPKLALSPLQELSAETDERSSPQPKAYPLLIAIARRNWRTCAALLAMLADVGILTLSFFAAALLQYPTMGLGEIVSSHLKFYLFFVGVFLCLFTSMGIYRTVSYTPLKRHFFAATKAYVYSAAIILSTLFLFGNTFYSRPFLMTLFTLMVAVYWMVWLTLRQVFRVLRKRGYGQWSTLVVGPAANVEKLLDRFEEYPDLGYDPIRRFNTSLRYRNDGKLHVNTADIEHEILRHRSEVLVLTSPDLNGSYDELESVCRKHRVRMRVVSPETDALYSQVRIHDIAGLPLFSPERRRLDAVKRFVKRAFDLVVASVLLVVTSPIFLLVAIATRLESHGPVFFKQKRSLSDRDEPFVFYKFRSMHHEADEKKASLFPLNESNGALFKIKNDPRLTRVGRFIRRYSIDELPQLINVLKGEMSLVGPRPLPVDDFARVTREDDIGGYYRARAKAKPGITGLWQVSGRSHLGFKEMVMLDLYYIENQSLLFDVEILAQTVPVVLFGKGAY
jgi:exopolysaccharide biosynthesis polyprenyl glycosylphosphotransferase